ncbi:hypothetical protein IJS77_00945 [bacterium]|nr:hypothetical protein [bacterium]
MSEEIKEEQTKKCECKGKCVKIFLMSVLASFLGCLIALCIFSAATKPKFPPQPMMHGPMYIQNIGHGFNPHQKHFKDFKGQRPDFQQNFRGQDIQRNFNQRPDFQRGNEFQGSYPQRPQR